jgi:hypothetical protein
MQRNDTKYPHPAITAQFQTLKKGGNCKEKEESRNGNVEVTATDLP